MQMVYVLVSMETFLAERRIPAYGAWASYIQKLCRYGIVPLFVHPFLSAEALDDLYNRADGVHCMGGGDWEPALYGKQKHEKTSVTESPRDALEMGILKRTLADRKPFFGICRGCQGLGIASGGTLVQHVPDVAGHGRHSQPSDQTYDDLAGNRHAVVLDPSSRAYAILKKERLEVDSGHHQAVATVGKDFRIVGKSEEGITEIIEHTDPEYFCFAVQSHPEVEENGDLEPLFAAFAQAALAYHAKKTP